MRKSTKKALWILGSAAAFAVVIMYLMLQRDERAYEDKRDPKKPIAGQPSKPIIVKVWKTWAEFATEVAITHDASQCEVGQDKVLNWHDKYYVRCMAIAKQEPRYCAYFDLEKKDQKITEKSTAIFQAVCINDVLRFAPRDAVFPTEVCNGLSYYPVFKFLYNECMALVTRDGNYCVATKDLKTAASMPDGPEQSLQCLARLASYTQNKKFCDLAHSYEKIFLDDGSLDWPATDILAGCPLPF